MAKRQKRYYTEAELIHRVGFFLSQKWSKEEILSELCISENRLIHICQLIYAKRMLSEA